WITVDADNLLEIDARYSAEYERLHGEVDADRPLEAVAARVEASCRTYSPHEPRRRVTARCGPRPFDRREVTFTGIARETDLHLRDELHPGQRVSGPALIVEPHSTIVVAPHWRAERLSGGELLIERFDDSEASRMPGNGQ